MRSSSASSVMYAHTCRNLPSPLPSPTISAQGPRAALRCLECNAVESEPYVGTQFDAATFVDVRLLANRYLNGRTPSSRTDPCAPRSWTVTRLLGRTRLPDGPPLGLRLEFDDQCATSIAWRRRILAVYQNTRCHPRPAFVATCVDTVARIRLPLHRLRAFHGPGRLPLPRRGHAEDDLSAPRPDHAHLDRPRVGSTSSASRRTGKTTLAAPSPTRSTVVCPATDPQGCASTYARRTPR